MLHSCKNLNKYSVALNDDKLGNIFDFLFSFKNWSICFIIMNRLATSGSGKAILNPFSFGAPRWGSQTWPLKIPKEQIAEFHDNDFKYSNITNDKIPVDLHQVKKTIGYQIRNKNEVLGKIDDFIIDDENWSIPFIAVRLRELLFGKRVLIPAKLIERIIRNKSTALVNLTREKIKMSPEYDPATPINKRYEEVTYDFYGRPINTNK